MHDFEKKNKLPGIFVKQNIKLIVTFVFSVIIVFTCIGGLLPVLYQFFTQDKEILISSFLTPVSIKTSLTGFLLGIGFIVFAMFRFSIAKIVSLIRFFVIIFILMFLLLNIAFRIN
jgi:hypothetical protein